mgnify:CR=1 FL=1
MSEKPKTLYEEISDKGYSRRDFVKFCGMMAALSDVHGDACVIMSADLQDPPEMISEMIQLWATGIDHVYTIISFRHGESRFRRVAAEIFYWMAILSLSYFYLKSNKWHKLEV